MLTSFSWDVQCWEEEEEKEEEGRRPLFAESGEAERWRMRGLDPNVFSGGGERSAS